MALATAACLAACGSSTASKPADAAHDAGPILDALVDMRADANVPPPQDAVFQPDFFPEPDFAHPDMETPDGPPPPGDLGVHLDFGAPGGPACDPRLRSAACDPGFYCKRDDGGQAFQGHCFEGEHCVPGDPASCPDPLRPYCHIQGGATLCTAAGNLREGDDCTDREEIPQPCREGLACNFSICQRICNPDASMCEASERCDSIEGAIGVKVGFCEPPACDLFTARGCMAGQKCSYAIRNDDVVVGSCTALDGVGNGPDAPCGVAPGGGDNCAVGLVCIGPPDQQRYCKILCDTGGYLAPCPDGNRCVEALATHGGNIHGLGICITNQ